MLGVILAAGRGKRFKPFTYRMPKVFIEVQEGITLLDLAIRTLRAAGLEELVVVTGYRSREVEKALAGLEGVRVVRNPEYWRENGISLLRAREAVGSEEFVMVMADHVFEPGLVRLAMRSGPLGLCVDKKGKYLLDPGEATKVAIGPGGLIRAVGKGLRTWDAYDTGVFACNEFMFWAAEELALRSSEVSISDCVNFLVSRGIEFKALDATGMMWADVDTPEVLQFVKEKMLEHLLSKIT